jgi:hypothetical protein
MPNEPTYPLLPENYMTAIGRAVLGWNFLESLILHTSIMALLGDFATDGRAEAVFLHMSFPQKLDALEAMLRIIDPDLAGTYREQVLPLLKLSQEKRNATLHQTWYPFADGVRRLNVKARGELKRTLTPIIPIEDVEEVYEFIIEAHSVLFNTVTLRITPKDEPQQGQ